MSEKSYNARTIFGRLLLLNLIALIILLVVMAVLEGLSSLREDQPQGALPRMVRKSTTLHVNAPKTQNPCDIQWFAAMPSCLTTDDVSQTFCGVCYGPP